MIATFNNNKGKEFVFVGVSKFIDPEKPAIIEDKIIYSQSNGLIISTIKIPKANYKIIGLAKELTEEQWDEIVESEFFDRGRERLKFYINYLSKITKTYSDTMKVTESSISLLKSLGFEPTDNVLTLEVI